MWPGWYAVLWGVTWGNNMAALEWVIAVGILTFLFRKYIKILVQKFRKPLHDHIQKELSDHKKFLEDKLIEHHDKIINEIRGNNGKENTGS